MSRFPIRSASRFPKNLSSISRRSLLELAGLTVATGFPGGCSDDTGIPDGGALGSVTVLAADQPGITWILLDGGELYWTNTSNKSTVMRLPLGGGDPTPVATNQDSPGGLAVDESHVYWTNIGIFSGSSGAIMRAPKTGGAAEILADKQIHAFDLVLDDQRVYWTTYNAIKMMPKKGGTPSILASGLKDPFRLALGTSHLYWTDSRGVSSVPLEGGTPSLLAEASGSWCMALDDLFLYWTDRLAGTISRVPIGGGTPETILSGQNIPYALVLDGAHLFWTNSSSGMNNGSLMRANRDGKDVKIISKNLYYPQGLTLNESHFFLAESRNGARGRVLQISR